MKFNLLTRDEALAITQKSEAFFVQKTEVQGYKVEMYNYRLAGYEDFVEHNAWEMRGLTFVFNPETNKWERNLALQKFFNVNQTPDWLYSDVKDKEIVSVQEKADGSMITFVRLPNGKVRAKTKMSFESEQAKMAQKVYDENENYQRFIKTSLDAGHTPIFEIVSPFNQIVVLYDVTKLELLQIRLRDGSYIMSDFVKVAADEFDIPSVKNFKELRDLDTLLELKASNKEDIEGWVITFKDGQMAKVKTDAYLAKHGTVSEIRENSIIKATLDEEVDDILSVLTPNTPKYDQVLEISSKTAHYFNAKVDEVVKFVEENWKGDFKDFADKHKTEKDFWFYTKAIKSVKGVEKGAEDIVKYQIKKDTFHLMSARKWLGGK